MQAPSKPNASGTSPYRGLPAASLWKESVANRPAQDVLPALAGKFTIDRSTGIASAGSCFAQRISEELQRMGYRYLLEEPGPKFLSDAMRRTAGYSVYSARYGNIYTAAQLLQLALRADGSFTPQEPLWAHPDGGVVDPFRPAVQPGGFASEEECLWDRKHHLEAVQRLLAGLDVFIFTLGLTESWRSASDGAVFPVAPGSGLGGTYDPAKYRFHNFSVAEVVADVERFLAVLSNVNAKAKVILTVSPVPLIATFEPRHVLQATTYSKSVLRVAAEEIARKYPNADYFPSFEIVSSLGDTAPYFEADRRTVRPQAVEHVMACFAKQFFPGGASDAAPGPTTALKPTPPAYKPMCDEDEVLAALAQQDARPPA